jgi:Uncharacterized homolog of phage Mu protein gp47
MAGYTPEGFERKRLPEILADKNQAQLAALGPDLNLAPETADGQISGLMALSDDQLWQIAEYAVNATDPDNATFATLSNLVKLNFIERLGPAPTMLVMALTGTPGVTIAAGQLIGEEDGSLTALTTAPFTFAVDGTANAAAALTITGPIEVAATTFTKIITPQAGWISATNPSVGIVGRDVETDAELRLRRARSTGTNSQNMIDSLKGKLANISGMVSSDVIENKTDVVDANGLTPHSFEAVVIGGDTNVIAQTIWDTYPFGIGWQGNTSGIAIDKQGTLQVVPFTRAVAVSVYVAVHRTTLPGYPATGDADMKQAIVDYANGDLVPGRGFFMGDTVVRTELYTPVNTVPDHNITDVFIARTPAPAGTANLPMTVREYPTFLVANITVGA